MSEIWMSELKRFTKKVNKLMKEGGDNDQEEASEQTIPVNIKLRKEGESELVNRLNQIEP